MFKKTKIAAITAAVLGLSSVALVPSAQAVSINEAGSTGQVLIFPYYNVNNGFTTSFNITNTTDKYKAVKMRFRESKTSNDILDFNVYMSPEDVFTLFLTKSADGGVSLSTDDNTCTHPKFPGTAVPFRDVYDSVENADMREGYLEVIEMGEIDEASVVEKVAGSTEADDIKIASEGLLHNKSGADVGKPINCDVIELAWQQGVFVQGGAASNTGAINLVDPKVPGYPDSAALGGATASTANFYGTDSTGWNTAVGALTAPTGGLAGSSVLLDLNNIAGFVAEPISIVNYSTVPQHYLSSDQNFYLLPSLASGDVLTTDSVSDDSTAMNRVTWSAVARDFGLDDQNVLPRTSVPSGINPMPMAHALAVTSLSNQYFLGGDTSTDWVVAAPMRKHGVFNGYEYKGGATDATAIPTGAFPIGLASTDTTDALKLAKLQANGYWALAHDDDVKSSLTYYNREENKDEPSVSAGDFSPPLPTNTPDASIPFTREVNVLALTASGSSNPSVLGSDHAQGISLATGFDNGWGVFSFATYDLAANRYTANTSGHSTPVNGVWTTFTATTVGAVAKGVPLAGFMAAKGSLSGQNVGEVFPHIIGRAR